MSLFSGPRGNGIRWDNAKLVFGDLAGATDVATAKLLITLSKGSKWLKIQNTFDKDITVVVRQDGSVEKHEWIEIAAGDEFEIKMGDVPGFEIEVKTTIFIYSATPATGAVRFNSWG